MSGVAGTGKAAVQVHGRGKMPRGDSKDQSLLPQRRAKAERKPRTRGIADHFARAKISGALQTAREYRRRREIMV